MLKDAVDLVGSAAGVVAAVFSVWGWKASNDRRLPKVMSCDLDFDRWEDSIACRIKFSPGTEYGHITSVSVLRSKVALIAEGPKGLADATQRTVLMDRLPCAEEFRPGGDLVTVTFLVSPRPKFDMSIAFTTDISKRIQLYTIKGLVHEA